MKGWLVSLFHALFPFADPDRAAWRGQMERHYEASRRQNLLEPHYLKRGTRD